ncbi:hypothetical protein ACS0TY_027294 [Phlomoides rotata]
MAEGGKKKIVVAGLASILLVAAVVAVTVGVTRKDSGGESSSGGSGISTSTKAVNAICSPTDYKTTCEKTLAGANSTNPKDLIKVAFEATVQDLQEAIKNSTLYKGVDNDPRTKGALEVCEEVLNDSVDELRRSFDKVSQLDVAELSDYVDDLKTWLSAAITYQDTCIDAFENTTGETGEKMKKMLRSSGEMLSNGLAMVTDFSSILVTLQIGGFTSRRLLGTEDNVEYPDYVGGNERKLLAASPATLKPNAVVAQDGSGQFKTIGEAVAKIPPKNNQTYVIYVKAGVYKETVVIPKKVNQVVLLGDGPLKTRISGSKSFAGGVQTFHTAVLVVNGEGFMAKDIGIENTAGPEGHQAVAVRASGDRSVFYNVHMDGYQDTLYAHAFRQFYRDCRISGTIDFIFGDATAVFQGGSLVVRKPMNNQACMVTAQGRKDRRSVGITVIQNCDISAEPDFLSVKPPIEAYLGRPWKQFSRTIIMQSNIEGFIAPEGWSPWMGTFGLDTLYYGEYQNRGPGADLSKRVKWKGIQKMTPQLAQSFTAEKLFGGDEWVKSSGVPYVGGMMQV